MADTHETIADIIAEIRALSNPISDGIIAINGRIIADRIEAAWRRETQAHKKELKARDAVIQTEVAAREAERDAHKREMKETVRRVSQVAEEMTRGTAKGVAPTMKDVDEWAVRLYDTIDITLLAPARNCDRFATVVEARKAHEAICEKYGKCHHGCPLNNEEHYSAFDCFEAWLFEPATEKEGGNDAN